MMRKLMPSILAADFANLGSGVEETRRGGAHGVHIDVMDGQFVPSISMGTPVVRSLRAATDLPLECHLMTVDPIRFIAPFAAAGADIILFHEEAAEDPGKVIAAIREQGKSAGMTIKPGTPVEALKPYLPLLDKVLIMTVEPGFGGQKYLEISTDRIARTAEMIRESGRDIPIEVDGGINLETLPTVLAAGADEIVSGTSVYCGDIAGNCRRFLQIMAE